MSFRPPGLRNPMRTTPFLLSAALLGAALFGPAPPRRAPQVEIRALITIGMDADLRWPDLIDVQPDLRRLYASRDWTPLWFTDDTLATSAHMVIRTLQEAEARGLDPEDYDAGWLAAQAEISDTAMVGRIDVALSVAAARFTLALRHGRVSAAAADSGFRLTVDSFDLAGTLNALAASEFPDDLLQGLEPPFRQYWQLIAGLSRYRQLALDYSLLPLPPMPALLRPGGTYAGVNSLRQLLWALGDYRDSLPLPYPDSHYTGPLVTAVQLFQLRQGFTPDGVIGPLTRSRLNRPFEQRIRQIELALERWRWMPRVFAVPPVIVNIPAFRLHAFRTTDLDATSMLAMNVVVGTAFRTETPVFAARLEYLIFSPYWEVPASIALADILPEARKDPEFLARNRYELADSGKRVPPWPENIRRIGDGISVLQTPGPHNALGLVKFILPNDYYIYLHDTPSKSLFERTRRDASHGCIRVADAFGLARFLLRDQPEWTDERILAAMNAGAPMKVLLSTPVPIIIAYATAEADGDGDLFFYSDVYGHDEGLDQLLRRGYPYPR